MPEYEATSRAVLKQVKEALPNAACLIVGPLDRAKGQMDFIPVLEQGPTRTCCRHGLRFLRHVRSDGRRWQHVTLDAQGFGGADFIHPTIMGGDIIAGWLYDAMMSGFETYKSK
ncbi:MAG: hypothetical protein U0165_13050 [Polyangiaceae bacterium]